MMTPIIRHAQPAEPNLPLLPVDPHAISLRIKALIDMHGSIPKVARLCGIPQPTLESYVRHGNMPGAITLGLLCTGLDVSADWVLFGRGAK